MNTDESNGVGGDTGVPETPKAPRPVYDADQINELRKRLYSRESVPTQTTRHGIPQRENVASLSHTPSPVLRPQPISVAAQAASYTASTASAEASSDTIEEDMPKKKIRKKFRVVAGLVGAVFFLIALGAASVLMFWGGNTISGENISITASGNIAVGGGEEYAFQVSVANQNNVPIQSATLIIEYPKGTRSATEEGKELSVERQSLDTIDTGELVNVELKAKIYGEENEDKEIKVWIEYRVAGSNATFEKYAEPLKLKVTTSPIVMTFDTVKKVATGEEVELSLIVQSNSPTPLTDILIKTYYPEGFDFTSADPDTVSGEDTWKLNTLMPNEKKVIIVKGLLTGNENDARRFSAAAGVPKEGTQTTLASQLATADTEIVIESPFLDIGVVINGSPSDTVVVRPIDTASVQITYKNTLDTAIYDGKVSVELSGNALSEYQVHSNGYYDSNENTLVWDGNLNNELKEILPGETVHLDFSLNPSERIGRTPQVNIKVAVEGKRLYENSAQQKLEGNISRTVKVESAPTLASITNFSEGPFANTGPVPPVAEKATTYTYLLTAKAGTNDLTGAEVTAILPQAVTWKDVITPGDNVTYNATNRTLKWTIGDMGANTEASAGIQVSFLPSVTQIGTTPTILDTQRLKATDRFTGTTVRAEASALTTSLTAGGVNDEKMTGRVVAK